MKKIPEQPSPDENDLFQQAMAGVTPIASSNRIAPSPPSRRVPVKKSSISTQTSAGFFSDHDANDIAQTFFLRPGLNNMSLRKLRRGFWPLQDTIDLHGSSSEEARRLLHDFLQHALYKEYRCVSVIHGKGWHAERGEGILKTRVRHWLTQFPAVLAYCEPPANAGGGGAVWVLLKSGSNKKTQRDQGDGF